MKFHLRPYFGAAVCMALMAAISSKSAWSQSITVKADTMAGFFGGGQGAPPQLVDVTDAKSPKCVGNYYGGAWVEFPVTAAKAGWYKISGIESGSDTSQGDAYVTVDTRAAGGATHFVTKPLLLPNTGGWTTWVTTGFDTEVPLKAGDNVLRVWNVTTNLRRPDAVTDQNPGGGGVNLTDVELTFDKDLQPSATLTGKISSSDLLIPVGFGKVTTGSVKTPHNWWIEDYWTSADAAGNYALEVPAGSYTLTGFRADTYQPNKVTGVQADAGKSVEAPEIKLASNWKDGVLKQQTRDIDKIIPGGATGFYDETNANPVVDGENVDDTRIVSGWWDANDWTEQLVDVPENGWYKVQLEFSTGSADPFTVRYDANGLFTQSDIDGSGNWRDYILSDPLAGSILLVKGTNRVRLTLIKGGFNEAYHVLTKTTGPKVGLIAGKVKRADGKPLDADIEVTMESGAGDKGVARPGADGSYQAFSAVGTYTASIADVFGYRVGDKKTGLQVNENQTTTVPDLSYTTLPFFLGVNPANPPSTAQDDDFTGTALATKWTSLNLGSEDSGDAVVKDGALNTTATQVDLWGAADNGHYVYQKVKGDFIAYIKMVSIPTFEDMGDWSKHGLMVRQSENVGSPHFTLLAGSGRRTIIEYRSDEDGATTSGAQPNESFKPGQWLKLVRKGGSFSGFWSYDDKGETYNLATPLDIHIPAFDGQDEVLVGIADTTGLSAVGTPANAIYSGFRLIGYDDAMKAIPTTPQGVKGDITGDGKVNIADATAALQFAVGNGTPSAVQLTAGDVVGGDGKITIPDVTKILQAAIGAIQL